MLPNESDMRYCIWNDGQIVNGAHGLAIGVTEDEAWARALDPCEPWVIDRAVQHGCVVLRCAILVINPPKIMKI